MKTTITAQWTGEKLNYLGTDSKGHQIEIGAGNITPGQMLLMAFAGCMGMDVVHVLNKKRQKITDVQVTVTGIQPDKYPKPYQVVEIAFLVSGNDIDPQAVERAIQLSEETYCIVGQTLKNPVEIKTTYTIH